jgi:outer membrane protein OmpA-like peptidoglycan-associated protein
VNNAMFMIPHVRGAGFVLDVYHDPAVGSVPSVDELQAMSTLITQWSGLLRALALCGYRAVELFVEVEPATATQRLLLDVGTLGLGSADIVPDELGGVRGEAPALLVAVTLDPLWPFGERAGVPLALPLPVGEIEAIDGAHAPVHETQRGWIAFTADDPDLAAARDGLVERGRTLAALLAGTVTTTWGRALAPAGPPAGLSWLFDDRNWWFPPDAPDRPRPDARLLGNTLRAVAEPLRTGAINISAFVTEQVARKHDPRLLSPSGSFANLTRTYAGQSPDAAVGAYRDRVSSLTTADLPGLLETADVIDDRFTWTDAVLAMIEHGAVGAAHRLLPGVPESVITTWPMPSTPEWTIPQVTGQWDADPTVGRKDTLILNQAGTSIAGYWQLHYPMELERYQLAGTLLRRDTDGSLVFTVQCWAQPGLGDVGPFLETPGEIKVLPVAGAAPELLLETDVAGDPGIYLFAKTAGPVDGAHQTEATMAGLPEPLKERIRALRDAPLHYEEFKGAYHLLATAATFIQRFLEEQPELQALLELMQEFKEAADDVSFVSNDELLATAGFYVKSILAGLQALGSDTALSVLLQMFRLTYSDHYSVELQRIYDLKVLPEGIGDFRYQWRLINVSMIGPPGLGVGHARGTGTFELRRVNASGQEIPPVVSRTIDLYANEIGTVMTLKATGPGDFPDWMNLDRTTRDIVPHLDGATLSLIGASGGWLIAESTGTIDVTLQPNDGLPPLRGYIDAALLEFPIFDPLTDELDPEEVYDRSKQVKDLVDTLKEIAEKVKKGLEESAKKGLKEGVKGFKKIKPDFKMSTLDGWIRTADGQPTKPVQGPVPIDEYVDGDATWARFATGKYELTPEFRGAIREMLLQHLALFTGLGEVVIEGNASQVGSDDYNTRLSRDRAVSVLTAIYDILGPQLAIPFGDLRVRGLGSSQATGDPESDEAIDRRVDVIIRGSVRMRS